MEKLEQLEADPGAGDVLDFADAKIIRLLMRTAGAEKDEILCGALWALSESVQSGGLCLPCPEIPMAAAFEANANAGNYAAILGSETQEKPLIRFAGRLYFHRHFHAEQSLARGLKRLMEAGPFPCQPESVRMTLEKILAEKSRFTPSPTQQIALNAALRERVFLLTGGPGTGKTALTAILLRSLIQLRNLDPSRIRLCAPTGRAAQRLRESILADGLDLPVETLHRLLGFHPPTSRFARHAGDPLEAGLVLVDEASMADVFILAALAQALPTGASLFLVGDANQLPSVGAGSVLNELLPGLRGAPVPSAALDHSHRSGREVLALSTAVRNGDEEETLRALGSSLSAANLPELLEDYSQKLFFTRGAQGLTYAECLEKIHHAASDEENELLQQLATFLGSRRILTCARHGLMGCEHINRQLRRKLETRFDPEAEPGRARGFHGAPLLIRQNDERSGLSNGDVGIWLRRDAGLAAYFPRPGKWLRVSESFLPPHEPAFAVTVHKSQGSECDEILLVLPEEGNRLLSREILYTGITRARNAVRVCGSETALREALRRRSLRAGGLREYFLS